MSSPARIIANKSNAQHSSGPTSVEGKAITRFNAMKHGLDAASLVIPGENPDELAALARDFHAEFQPFGVLETEFVETLVRTAWFQHRYARIEAQLYHTILAAMDQTATVADAFHKDAAGPNSMGKLFRRQQAVKRDFARALAELRRLQKLRAAASALQPVQVPVATPKPAVQPAPVRHPKPVPGQPWVGSEPPSWRL